MLLVKQDTNTTVLSYISKRTIFPTGWYVGGPLLHHELHSRFWLVGRMVFFSRPSVVRTMSDGKFPQCLGGGSVDMNGECYLYTEADLDSAGYNV
ncbi:hypothetical protein TNCV_2329881 [Trichonephila clavipes]|nr:hypothetical protein TNCV_2329881 [Trichonephila clavipes]